MRIVIPIFGLAVMMGTMAMRTVVLVQAYIEEVSFTRAINSELNFWFYLAASHVPSLPRTSNRNAE
jgi:hypothetical protein